MMEALLGADDPRAGLESLQPKDGFYVPSRYEVRYHDDGTVAAYDGPGRVVRQRGWPGAMGFPQSVILTPHTEMSMKYMVEISRGCPCMCRFCWAGYNYLPGARLHARGARGARARGARASRARSASSRRRSATTPRSTASSTTSRRMDYEVSVASLRLDDLTPRVRVQARRHRRPGPDPRARVRLRPHAEDPQQAVHERRDPRQGHLDLRERHRRT